MGSNPAIPTKEKGFDNQWFDAVFKAFFIIKIFILLIKKKEFLPINGHKNLSKTYPLILISMATLKLTIFKAKVLKDGRHKIRGMPILRCLNCLICRMQSWRAWVDNYIR